ncbi:MAG: GCN5 family acetyltransferase [Acidovorax sp.]|nr:GCN5 family acetyltransferase [Acidovorax sp.]
MSPFPVAVDPDLVGEYPVLSKSGGGYFFDEVLEYRVWCHPERGAPDEYEGADYYCAFSTYEDALAFSQETPGSEEPLALIRRREWINEPSPGTLLHEKGERITEWCVEWLESGPRRQGEIEAFIGASGSA